VEEIAQLTEKLERARSVVQEQRERIVKDESRFAAENAKLRNALADVQVGHKHTPRVQPLYSVSILGREAPGRNGRRAARKGAAASPKLTWLFFELTPLTLLELLVVPHRRYTAASALSPPPPACVQGTRDDESALVRGTVEELHGTAARRLEESQAALLELTQQHSQLLQHEATRRDGLLEQREQTDRVVQAAKAEAAAAAQVGFTRVH
jgi:hypothetical protein